MNISEICVKRPVFAVMLISFLVVLGIFSFRDLGVDLFPKTDPATVTVKLTLPGATPEEMTSQVILPLEDALSGVSGMDEMTSLTDEGKARIKCVFVLDRDVNDAAQDIREKVAGAIKQLPPNMDPPVIQKVDPDADPVLSVLVAGGADMRDTTEIADKRIKRALETVDGVGEVDLLGGRPREIRVFADVEKLNAYGITISQVENAIQSENIEVPGGTMRRGDTELGVRTLGRIQAADQFANIIITNVHGTPIRVRDIGRVEDSYPDQTSWNLYKGKQAVVLLIQRQSGSNTLAVIEATKKKLAQVQKTLPPGVVTQIIQDQSIFIRASLRSLEEHLVWGGLLAAFVVLLFIKDWRSVLIASLAIPTSIIATFSLLKFMHFTLNNMTLLALTLAVGIVIDDAIVVLENIVRFLEEKRMDPFHAAIEGTREIMLAVMATTLSLVVIFIPVAFVSGYARRYLNQFGWTMAFAVMVSMLVSFTLTPMLCSLLLKRIERKRGTSPEAPQTEAEKQYQGTSKDSRFFLWLDNIYDRMLVWSLDHRALVIFLAIGVFLLTFPLNAVIGRDFIPADDQSEFQSIFDSPVNTSLAGTAKYATEIAHRIEKIPGVKFTWAHIDQRDNHCHTYVRLVDISKRKLSSLQIADEIRHKIFPDYPNLRMKIAMPSALGSGENYGSIRPMVLGPDYYRAAALAEQAAAQLRKIPGLVDVSAELNINSPELQIRIDRQRASDLGVRASDVANAVRLMIAGTDQISTYKEGQEQYAVTMQLLPKQQRDPAVLEQLMIPSSKVGQVRLDNIATIVRGFGPAQISRYNRLYMVSMNANNEASLPLGTAVKEIRATMKKMLPHDYVLRFTGTVRVLDKTMNSMFVAFLLAAIFMYMVLAAQFESLVDPFIIMLKLPLALSFALLTLWLTHRTLNLWSVLGVFLLLGIIKKNAILQVDCMNQLRREGMPLYEAILRGNHIRFRPILMTTAAIVAGLIPTATGIGAGAAQRSAIAVTIIGGQILSLLLTLTVIPVSYSLFAGLREVNVLDQTQGALARLRMGLARVFTLF